MLESTPAKLGFHWHRTAERAIHLDRLPVISARISKALGTLAGSPQMSFFFRRRFMRHPQVRNKLRVLALTRFFIRLAEQR